MPDRICSFPGCQNLHRAFGLCQGHRMQELAGRALTTLRPKVRKANVCRAYGCQRLHYALGLCQKDYARYRRGTLPALFIDWSYACRPDCPRKGTGTCYEVHKCRCPLCKTANAARAKRRRLERDPSTVPPEAHGKVSTYRNWDCRCEPCKAAGKEANAAANQARKSKPIPEDVHGQQKGYGVYGCRCEPCKVAAAIYRRGQSQRDRDAA